MHPSLQDARDPRNAEVPRKSPARQTKKGEDPPATADGDLISAVDEILVSVGRRRRVSWPPGGGRSSPSWGGRAQVEDFAKVDEDLVGNSSKNSSRRRTAPAGSPTAKAAVAGFGPSSRPPPHELASQSAGLPGAFGIRSQPAEQRIRLRLSPASPIGGAPVAPEGPGAYGSPNIKHKTHCTGLYVILRR